MSLTFVIADIHGCADLLDLALLEISKKAVSGTVIFLGDYVDRGPDSRRVIETLMRGPAPGWTWKCLKGNHEDMMEECISGHEIAWWKRNGGSATLESYAGHDADLYKHLSWIKELPRIYNDSYRVYVHAGVSETFDLNMQPEAMTQWYRYPDKSNVGYRGMHVVHGHTADAHGPELYSNRTNLDIWAVGTGVMAIGVFDDEKAGGPIDVLYVSNVDHSLT